LFKKLQGKVRDLPSWARGAVNAAGMMPGREKTGTRHGRRKKKKKNENPR